MKRLMLLIAIHLLFAGSSFADPSDTVEFTVIAPSGLSLRSGPAITAKRLDLVPFGTVIKVNGLSYGLYDPVYLDTIDQRIGYWLKTYYRGNEGFLFSGYLKTGDLYLPATEINHEYRIMTPGLKCQSVNYDPELYWYGLYYDKKLKKTKVRSVNMDLDYGAIPLEEMEMSYFQQGDFTQVGSDSKDSCFLFIGSKKPLPTGMLKHERSFLEKENPQDWRAPGKFVYPYERFQIAKTKYSNYQLVGHEEVTIRNQKYIQRNYKLFLSNSHRNWLCMNNKDTVELTQALVASYSTSINAIYKAPQIQWMGDLNDDDFPDFIFYTPNMSEGCGGSEFYNLLISEKGKDHFILKKVAEEENYSCHGC